MRGQPENCRKENTLEGTWRYMYDQNVGPVNDIQQSPDVKQPRSQAFPPPTFDRLQCEKTEQAYCKQSKAGGGEGLGLQSQCKVCVYQHMQLFITSTVLSSLQRQKREQQDMVSEGSFVIVILYSRQNLICHLGYTCMLYQLKTPHITVYCIRLLSLHSSGVSTPFWPRSPYELHSPCIPTWYQFLFSFAFSMWTTSQEHTISTGF